MKKVFLAIFILGFIPNSYSQESAVVAVIAACTPKNTEIERNYAQVLSDSIRSRLSDDKTITTLPATVTDDAISGLTIQGFVNSDEELNETLSKLPVECNIVIIVGPHPENSNSGWFKITIARRSNLSNLVFKYGPPIGDAPSTEVITNCVGMVRMDIDEVIKQGK